MNKTLNFYINQLSPKRATIHSKSWWVIGNAIYKLTKGSKEGYDLWHKFSAQDIDDYTNNVCDKKWAYFKKNNYFVSINTIVGFVYEDGGSVYNPDHKQMIVDEKVRNLVYNVLLPKLSIRRMRNMKALINLCSALYHMSSGEDRFVLDGVCKRIKDKKLRKIFVSSWDSTYFSAQYGLNDIICWLNNDEKEKPHPRATNIKLYTHDNPLWLEQTTNYLKFYDNAGYTPRYFKVNAEERKKLKPVVARRSNINLALDAGCFDLAESLIKKNIL